MNFNISDTNRSFCTQNGLNKHKGIAFFAMVIFQFKNTDFNRFRPNNEVFLVGRLRLKNNAFGNLIPQAKIGLKDHLSKGHV